MPSHETAQRFAVYLVLAVGTAAITAATIGFVLHMLGADTCGTVAYVALGVIFGIFVGMLVRPRDFMILRRDAPAETVEFTTDP